MFKKTKKPDNVEIVTNKVKLDLNLYPILDLLQITCRKVVIRMLLDRTKSSSKYYKEIPCVVAKSLVTKYQKNKKCKEVKKLVIPICGDKGKQVKLVGNNIRVPSIFKKELIPIQPLKPIFGFVLQVEFFKRKSVWYMSYSYYTKVANPVEIKDVVGVDFNVRDNVATIAYGENGSKVRRLGPDVGELKCISRKRVAKLQSKGKVGLCKKLSKKQLNRQKYINHVVSKQIVQIAREQSSAIVLEKLEPRKKGSKIKHYVEKVQWAFYQLSAFIAYKAALSSIPVYYVDPYRTSKTCSRCGLVMQVSGKQFRCTSCGHLDHRDANSAHNIRSVFLDPNWIPKLGPVGFIDDPCKVERLL